MHAQDRASFSLHSGHCRHGPVSGSTTFYEDVSIDGSPWGEAVEGLISPHTHTPQPSIPSPVPRGAPAPPDHTKATWLRRMVCWELASPTPTHPDGQAQERRGTLWTFRDFFAGIWELKWGEGGTPECLSSEVFLKHLQGDNWKMNRDFYFSVNGESSGFHLK